MDHDRRFLSSGMLFERFYVSRVGEIEGDEKAKDRESERRSSNSPRPHPWRLYPKESAFHVAATRRL